MKTPTTGQTEPTTTPAQNSQPRPLPSFAFDLILRPSPTLPATASTEQLLAFINDMASQFWRCQQALNALNALFAMQPKEGAAPSDYLDLIQAARHGMAAARQGQEQARECLERLASYPTKWAKWPERRAVPRLDL